MSQALVSVMRIFVRGYLAVFDAAMRLGPMRGAALLTYGPFVAASVAFLAKVYWLDAVIDNTLTTIAVFAIFALLGPLMNFALLGPLMNIGSKLLAEGWHKARFGTYPGQKDQRLHPKGGPSPTLLWVKSVRDWAE